MCPVEEYPVLIPDTFPKSQDLTLCDFKLSSKMKWKLHFGSVDEVETELRKVLKGLQNGFLVFRNNSKGFIYMFKDTI